MNQSLSLTAILLPFVIYLIAILISPGFLLESYNPISNKKVQEFKSQSFVEKQNILFYSKIPKPYDLILIESSHTNSK